MENKIITITIAIFLIGSVSAMLAGTCDTIEFPNEGDVSVEFTGNSSSMEGFSWSKSWTIITYCTDLNFKPDTFTVRWYNSEGEVKQQGGSGGSSYTKKEVIVNETVEDEIEVEEIIEDPEEEYIKEIVEAINKKASTGTIIIIVVGSILFSIIFNMTVKNWIKHSKKKLNLEGEKNEI